MNKFWWKKKDYRLILNNEILMKELFDRDFFPRYLKNTLKKHKKTV